MIKKHIVYLLFPVLSGCNHTQKSKPAAVSVPGTFALENRLLRDSAIKLLHSGDLVFRLGNDITSAMLSRLNMREKSYSHCGIVVMEGGKPYIYHSIGGEFNPDQKIKRETPIQWFSPKNNFAVAISRLHLDSNQLNNVTRNVQAYYKEGKKFDMGFDLASDDRLYCAEMIYKSVQNAINDSAYLPVTSAFGKKYVGIDDLYANRHSTIVCKLQYK